MPNTAAQINVAIANINGSFKFVTLHPSFVATSARQAEKLAVQSEGGYLQRRQTRKGVDGNGGSIWFVTLSETAAAARYWGPKAVAARAGL